MMDIDVDVICMFVFCDYKIKLNFKKGLQGQLANSSFHLKASPENEGQLEMKGKKLQVSSYS